LHYAIEHPVRDDRRRSTAVRIGPQDRRLRLGKGARYRHRDDP
jgi:hypothetical protein